MFNACTIIRLDSVVRVLNGKFICNCGTLPSQVPVWKVEHESTAEINSLLLTEISGSEELRLLG